MIGTTISHYKILEKLGEGGMGVVYKAADTKLGRTVALKFLLLASIGDDEKKRFKREAKAAAALNHANIAHIYAIDETDGKMFLAMEYIEGQSLHEMITPLNPPFVRGEIGGSRPLPLDHAVNYATQIAAGLQAAHEKGIVHRDIKSANIMVTEKGVVKIMDFGLAKLVDRTKMTQEGMTLGTAAYMSPEQARGEAVDRRADIWSLGVVIYEMITGQMPFKGDYEQAVLYSIMNEEPEPLTALRSSLPIALDGIIAKALAKDPATRYQNVEELPADLKGLHASRSAPSRISPTQTRTLASRMASRQRLLILGIIVVSLVIGYLLNQWLRSPTLPVVEIHRLNIALPESAPIAPVGSARLAVGQRALALSPDGRQLVYVADIGGQTQLFIRPLSALDATAMPGTEGAYYPFFSPDRRWVGFFSGNDLKKVSISDEVVITLCAVTNPDGASWGKDGNIVFASHEGSKLLIVPDTGGPPTLITDQTVFSYRWPVILPDGNHVLVTRANGRPGIVAIGSGQERSLNLRGQSFAYLDSGHLVIAQENRVEAVSFNPDVLEISGSPVPIFSDVRIEATGAMQWTASKTGMVVYLSGGAAVRSELLWLDRANKVTSLGFPSEPYGTFSLSPDQRRLAINIWPATENNQVWMYDLSSRSRLKFTVERHAFAPIWSPDGKWLAFASFARDSAHLFVRAADARMETKLLAKMNRPDLMPGSFSPDGKLITFNSSQNILVVSTTGADSVATFADSRFNEWASAFSPDGQWIAYTSDERGQFDVYVEPFPKTGERWPVSQEGGEEPVWSPETNELFYRFGRQWFVVTYQSGATFTFDPPRVLFEGDYLNVPGRSYDVSRDGQRFLLLRSVDQKATYSNLNVVTNWFEELKRKVPERR